MSTDGKNSMQEPQVSGTSDAYDLLGYLEQLEREGRLQPEDQILMQRIIADREEETKKAAQKKPNPAHVRTPTVEDQLAAKALANTTLIMRGPAHDPALTEIMENGTGDAAALAADELNSKSTEIRVPIDPKNKS